MTKLITVFKRTTSFPIQHLVSKPNIGKRSIYNNRCTNTHTHTQNSVHICLIYNIDLTTKQYSINGQFKRVFYSQLYNFIFFFFALIKILLVKRGYALLEIFLSYIQLNFICVCMKKYSYIITCNYCFQFYLFSGTFYAWFLSPLLFIPFVQEADLSNIQPKQQVHTNSYNSVFLWVTLT